MTFLWQQVFSSPLLPEIAAPCGPYDRSQESGHDFPILHYYFVHTSKMLCFHPSKHLFLHNKGYPSHKSPVSKSSSRGAKYAYESVSYWDKEKKQPRSKRKYIGRVDPETGEIIPTGMRANRPVQISTDNNILQDDLQKKVEEIAELKEEIAILSRKYERANKALVKILSIAKEYLLFSFTY